MTFEPLTELGQGFASIKETYFFDMNTLEIGKTRFYQARLEILLPSTKRPNETSRYWVKFSAVKTPELAVAQINNWCGKKLKFIKSETSDSLFASTNRLLSKGLAARKAHK